LRLQITENITHYSDKEELANVISHAAGLLLSIAALALLATYSSLNGSIWHIVSFSIFGSSLIALYAASTFYHLSKTPKARKIWNIIDHSAIYVLIAGTYTPYTLVTLHGEAIGWILFGIAWSMAIAGIVFKVFFTGKFHTLSTLLYILMGWLIMFAIKPLFENLPMPGFILLLAGGAFYTTGAVFYSIKKIKSNHAIFHIFVLAGSMCHFFSIYLYVL
jgi:hemolysin III